MALGEFACAVDWARDKRIFIDLPARHEICERAFGAQISRRAVVNRLTVAVVTALASALALLGASAAPTAGGG